MEWALCPVHPAQNEEISFSDPVDIMTLFATPHTFLDLLKALYYRFGTEFSKAPRRVSGLRSLWVELILYQSVSECKWA